MMTRIDQRQRVDGEHLNTELRVLRLRQPVKPDSPDRKGWVIPPDARLVSGIRRELEEWLQGWGVGENAVWDIGIIAGDLLANAAAAGRSTVSLRVWIDSGAKYLEVEDDGIGREDLGSLGFEQPGFDAEAGRGMFIVRALASRVWVLSTPEGTLVRCALSFDDPHGGNARLMAPERVDPVPRKSPPSDSRVTSRAASLERDDNAPDDSERAARALLKDSDARTHDDPSPHDLSDDGVHRRTSDMTTAPPDMPGEN